MGAPKGNKFAQGNKGGGRSTEYKEEYSVQVFKYCLLGATDEQIAEMFDVSVGCISKWKRNFKEFREAILAGRVKADAEIAHSMYHRAKGYSHPDVHIAVIDGKIVKTDIVKHYPPDSGAGRQWLNNRQAKIWKDKQVVEGTMTGQINITLDANDVSIGKAQ